MKSMLENFREKFQVSSTLNVSNANTLADEWAKFAKDLCLVEAQYQAPNAVYENFGRAMEEIAKSGLESTEYVSEGPADSADRDWVRVWLRLNNHPEFMETYDYNNTYDAQKYYAALCFNKLGYIDETRLNEVTVNSPC